MNVICDYFGDDHQVALDATGCDTIMCPHDQDRVEGINYIVQIDGCLKNPALPLPNFGAAVRELRALAAAGITDAITAHEIGFNHPGAVGHLRALNAQARQLGITTSGWCFNSEAANPNMTNPGNVDQARRAGIGVKREVRVMRPFDDFVTNVRVGIGELGEHPADAFVIHPVGNKTWQEGDPWAWPTSTIERLGDVMSCARDEGYEGDYFFWKWSTNQNDDNDGLREFSDHAAFVKEALQKPGLVSVKGAGDGVDLRFLDGAIHNLKRQDWQNRTLWCRGVRLREGADGEGRIGW